MTLSLQFIAGIMFGGEYVQIEDEEGVLHNFVVDVGFIRLMFQWE